MNSFTNIAQKCTYGFAVSFSICATIPLVQSISLFVGRLIYPLSQYDGEEFSEDHAPTDFFHPNAGIRIDEQQYEQLAIIRKVISAALMLFTGAFTGALIGTCITGVVVLAMNITDPILFALTGAVSSAVVGAIVAGLHDPKIGLPFLYHGI